MYLIDWFLLDHLQYRGSRKVPQLRVDWTEHRVYVHDNLVSGQRDQGSSRHGIVRHKDGGLCRVTFDRLRDLGGGKDKATGRMDDEVDRRIWVSEPNGPENFFRIFYID